MLICLLSFSLLFNLFHLFCDYMVIMLFFQYLFVLYSIVCYIAIVTLCVQNNNGRKVDRMEENVRRKLDAVLKLKRAEVEYLELQVDFLREYEEDCVGWFLENFNEKNDFLACVEYLYSLIYGREDVVNGQSIGY